MADYTVDVFNVQSINSLIEKLLFWKRKKIEDIERIVGEVADIGVDTINSSINYVQFGENITSGREMSRDGNTVHCRVWASSPDVLSEWKPNKGENTNTKGYMVNPLLLAEFGSGHHVENFFQEAMPEMVEGSLSNTVGSGMVSKPMWSYVSLEDNERHWTDGQQPTHPMFNASQRMREEFKNRKVKVT